MGGDGVMAKLGEVCKVSPSTKNIERQGAWLLNLDMVEQETGRVIEYKYVGEDDLNGSIVQFDTENVLYSKLRPNLNKVVLPQKDGFSTSELLPLRPDASVLNKDYLAAFLRSDSFVTWAVSKTAGAKMPRLGTKDLMNAEIPVPSIEQQKKIAEKFKKLEQLISLRKQQLAKLDELVKARFVEMFGDPKDNRSNLVKIGEIGDLTSGGTPSRSNSEYFNGSIRWYSAGELNSLYLPDSIEHISRTALSQSAAKLFEKGTLMIGMYDTAAFKMGILTEQSSSNQACANLKPTEQYSVIWLYYLFDIMKPIFLTERQGVRQKNLSLSKIRNFNIPSAPLSLQNQFAAFVERVDQQKQTVQQSLEKLELMKKALMQEYFG